MADISREEAIKFLKAHSEYEKKKVIGIFKDCNEELCDNCDLCYAQGNWGEHIQATDKAISDMQKLEKIEEIVDIVDSANSKTNNLEIRINNKVFCFSDIKRIVKGNEIDE